MQGKSCFATLRPAFVESLTLRQTINCPHGVEQSQSIIFAYCLKLERIQTTNYNLRGL